MHGSGGAASLPLIRLEAGPATAEAIRRLADHLTMEEKFRRQYEVRPMVFETVAFSAGNFAGNGSMTWTVASGDQVTYTIARLGKMALVSFQIMNSTIGGTPNTTLFITLPHGLAANHYNPTAASLVDAGVAVPGILFADGGQSRLSIQRADGAAFTGGTDNNNVIGQVWFEVT